MSTPIQNANESPYKAGYRQSEVPFESIIRQVATPSAYQEIDRGQASHKINVVTHQPFSFAAQNPSIPANNQAQFVSGVNLKGKSIVNIPPGPPVPADMPQLAPIRRVEYVPYEQKYIEYVQQRVKVPVQRVCTDYYQIEHIIDYVPIEKEEIVYEMQPKEIITMRLQYVPVEQKIIHISDKNAQSLGITNYVSTESKHQDLPKISPLYQEVQVPNDTIIGPNPSASTLRKSRTNFVTTQGYDPQANLQQIDNILASSRLRASKARIQQ